MTSLLILTGILTWACAAGLLIWLIIRYFYNILCTIVVFVGIAADLGCQLYLDIERLVKFVRRSFRRRQTIAYKGKKIEKDEHVQHI